MNAQRVVTIIAILWIVFVLAFVNILSNSNGDLRQEIQHIKTERHHDQLDAAKRLNSVMQQYNSTLADLANCQAANKLLISQLPEGEF